jgi:cell division septation protein DedD
MVSASTAVVEIDKPNAKSQAAAPAPDRPGVGPRSLFDDLSPVAQPSDPEASHSFQSNSNEELMFEFFEQKDPDYTAHRVEADLRGVSENESAQNHGDELSAAPTESISIAEYTPDHHTERDNSLLTEATCENTAPDFSERSSPLSDQTEEQVPIEGISATDPWDDPLPPWDYSHNEWPVLVESSNRASITRKQVSIAAIVLLVCAVGLYFLIPRSSAPEPAAASSQGTSSASADAEPGASAAETQRSDVRAQPANTSGEREAAGTQAASVGASSEGKAPGLFSLQAAAFATQVGADEFAEKLKQAGLPSYVEPADIARRGRWFRVRVGKFIAAEEAQRFAGEAQLRARAAGIAVQLIVCQSGRP